MSRSLKLVRQPEPVLVGDFLREWLNGKHSLRPSTRRSYQGHIELYLAPMLGACRLYDLTPRDVDRAYNSFAADPRRPSVSTRHRIHATLMSALNTAVQRGLIDRNPAATVELPRVARFPGRVWTARELGEFLELYAEDQLVVLFRLMGLLGLRRGEALALTWEHVDLEVGELLVAQTLNRVGAEISLGPPKSTSGRRILALDQGTQNLLRAGYGERESEEPWIFPAASGGPLDPAYVSRRFARLVTDSTLPSIRLHDLRHTSASIGIAAGESLVEVSRRLGHSSIVVTADIYSHVSPALSRRAAERLAQEVLGANR